MALNQDMMILLNQLDRPAFLAEDGKIVAVNERASAMMLTADTAVADLIQNGQEEYAAFSGEGALYLIICVCGIDHSATVTYLENRQLFVINDKSNESELQALSLAAGQLTLPLSEISLILERLSQIDPEEKAKIKKNLYRVQRIVGNMSDAAHLQTAKQRKYVREMGAFLGEILEKAQSLLAAKNLEIRYRLPETPIFAAISEDSITRAVYNLISNAAKFSPDNHVIHVQLLRQKDKLYLTVKDEGTGIDHRLLGNVFQRYTREPSLEDPKHGLGVGLTLVHAVAAAHGGTVLVEQNKPSGTKITMTISLKQDPATDINSPILKPDIYGGQDQALIELSDVLPYLLYMDN